MFQHKPDLASCAPIKSYGILVGIRIDPDDSSPEAAMRVIDEALSGLVGCDDVLIELLGEIDDFDLVAGEPEADAQ